MGSNCILYQKIKHTVMKYNSQHISFFISVFFLLACQAKAQQELPSDKKASKETKALYNNLKKLTSKGFMFGHQDDLAYGVNWKYDASTGSAGRSDIKDVAGDYPAVYGWELGGLELDHTKNLDDVPFDQMQQFIKEGYARGGVITISWHMYSPFGNGISAWDTTHGTVASIIPGGMHHELYKQWLDKVAVFFEALKGAKGESIPVLFRPFHEHSGSWFWWGRNNCSISDYKSLWRFTFDYLHTQKNLHNILWVYNTGGDFKTKEEFLERYPGDDAVDLVSFDTYQSGDPKKSEGFVKNANFLLNIVEQVAAEKNKLFALGETGFESVPYEKWWTETLIKAIGDHKISYVLLWRNHGYQESTKRMHYYAPFKGQVSANDFVEFYKLNSTLFEKDIKNEKLYR